MIGTFNDMEEHGRHRKSLEVRARQRYCVSRCVSRERSATLFGRSGESARWSQRSDLNSRPPGYEPDEVLTRLCFSMTYVVFILLISPLFFGSLFPICSRFVPSFSDCKLLMIQFSMGTPAKRAHPQCLSSRVQFTRNLAAGRACRESQALVGKGGVLKLV